MNSLPIDLLQPGLFRNPHATMRWLRDEDPVHWSPQLGAWLLTRHADVRAAMLDARLSVVEETKRVMALPPGEREALKDLLRIFLAWGGRDRWAEHTQFVGLMKRHFTSDKVASLRPFIATSLDQLIAQAAGSGQIDVVNDVAHRLAMTVVVEFLGIPAGAAVITMLLRGSQAISGLLEMGEPAQLRACQASMLAIAEHVRPLVRWHRSNQSGGLLDVFIQADREGAGYDDDYIVAQCLMFIVVGYHTTANLLSSGLQLLFDHPAQCHKLMQDRPLIANAFQEMMRFHGPVASVRRLALQDIPLHGKTIRSGDTVMLALVSANRDERVFPAPDSFDVERVNAQAQLGFTVGPFSCMGQALARLEGEVFFNTFLDLMPRLQPVRLAPDWVVFRPFGCELASLPVSVAA